MEGADAIARLLPDLDTWMLALVVAVARAGGFLLALPHATGTLVPKTARVAVAFTLALALVLGQPGQTLLLAAQGPVTIALATAGEFLLGLAMGAVIHLSLATVRLAGAVVGVEMGLSFAAVADPTSPGQATAVGALFAQIGIQLFLALGLDHVAIRALAHSTARVPLGQGWPRLGDLLDLATLTSRMFEGALALALPLMACLFALKIAMAMLARVAPRLQIFTLAFALSILTGLLVLDAALGGILVATAGRLQEWLRLLQHLVAAQ